MDDKLKDYLDKVYQKHGDQYEIDVGTFKGIKKELTASCKDHGSYNTYAYNILRSKGGACPKCRNKHRGAPSLNNKSFIKRVEKRHGELKFDYISAYKNMHEDILVRCKVCAKNFLESPSNHIKRYTCPHCIGIYNEIFGDRLTYLKDKIKLVHGSKYKYDFNTFKDFGTPFKIICDLHGEFYQTPSNHLRGNNCPECAYITRTEKNRMTNNVFLEKANTIHNHFFKYRNEYVNSDTLLEIECPKHGIFHQRARYHLSGRGCKQCFEDRRGNTLKLSHEKFIEKANEVHGQYLYENKYQGSKISLEISCPIHGPFEQRPNDHLNGSGCPKCARETTKAVQEICKLLDKHNIQYVENDNKILEGKELDIYVPEKKFAIEFNGLYFHREGLVDNLQYGKNKDYHLNKTNACLEKGIRLFHIFEDEWKQNKELILIKIFHALGINNKPIIGARKCIIKEIPNKESRKFLDKNHIQGGDIAKYRLGAFHEKELVGVLTLVKMKGEWKLNRFATSINYKLPGLASKMFKHALSLYNIEKITTFSDKRYGHFPEKSVYLKLAFKYIEDTKPAYWYYEMKSGVRHNRQKFMKHKILKQYPQYNNKNMSEKEMMIDLGYDRIWDCGHYKFVFLK